MKSLTIGQAVDLYNIIVSFNEQSVQEKIDLPGNISYALFRNTKKLESVFKFFTDKQKELIESNALKNKKGEIQYEDEAKGIVKLRKDNTLNKEFAEYVSLESGVDLYTINLDVEDLAKKINGSHIALNRLWFILDHVIEEAPVKVLESV
tara:strand:- start:37 stop:486 length:450 start_codon:yes stop_codon:yes gene_type:complete